MNGCKIVRLSGLLRLLCGMNEGKGLDPAVQLVSFRHRRSILL